MNVLQAVIIAIVEGLTEFLPVSSTGHMIITSSFMGIASHPFTKFFTVSIQLGAILSVIILYKEKFFQSFQFYFKLFIAFVPAAVVGKLFDEQIDALLENVWMVSLMLIAGGIILLLIDKRITQQNTVTEELTIKKAFNIGLFQCLALVPGVSRSAATIIGGLLQKLSKKEAAEFSFFLAVPTMFAATAYKMFTFCQTQSFNADQIKLLCIGNLVAFIVAVIAIKGFVGYITRNGFKIFGYYRIILGSLILLLTALGVNLQMI